MENENDRKYNVDITIHKTSKNNTWSSDITTRVLLFVLIMMNISQCNRQREIERTLNYQLWKNKNTKEIYHIGDGKIPNSEETEKEIKSTIL